MKNYTTGGLLVPALLIFFCSCAGSRLNADNASGNSPESFHSKSGSSYYLNDIDIRAVRHFKKHFESITNEKWYVIKGGFMAKCQFEGMPMRIDYDQKGNWLYSILYYDEKKLPRPVRALVKSTWYDYTISSVEEIRRDKEPVYIVHMHEGNDWRMVQVHAGEMKEIIMPGKPGSKIGDETL